MKYKHIFFALCICTLSVSLVLAQTTHKKNQNKFQSKTQQAQSTNKAPANSLSQEELDKKIKAQGAWIITKTSADFTDITNAFALYLENNIAPQALDRNLAGELLIIGQLSPPALKTYEWHLGIYESEKSMMNASEKLAKEGWVPTGMDVQQDAAFLLYLKSEGELLISARLIKLDNFQQLEKSIQTYYSLGFLPRAITTFNSSLWIFYVKLLDTDISKTTIIVKVGPKDDTSKFLTSVLADQTSSLIDATYTNDDKVLLLFQRTE